MAVGGTETSNGDVSFGDAWNGTNWTAEPVTQPTNIDLFGVSCLSSADCTAVGRVFGVTNQTPLAETWNGTSWSAQNLPLPAGALSTTMAAVSCTSATKCVAVGYDDSRPAAESWNGTSWTAQFAALPAGDPSGELLGVSCRSFRSCIAVGTAETSSRQSVPLAESWDGHQWTAQVIPVPSGSNTNTTLEAVSCHSATGCMAVGLAGGPRADQTLAEQWNGTAWTIVNMPRVGGLNAANGLAGVSCPRANRCTAAGDKLVRRKIRLLVEQWNGTRWTVGAPVQPTHIQTSAFGGVSCLAKQGCIAVGGDNTRTGKMVPLAEQHP
jgi:hypothetical protein